jgi:putative transposase
MHDHVHVIMQPHVSFAGIMQWLKSRTARQANRILDRANQPFWQVESFDHWIRTQEELWDLLTYVSTNPVRRGLVDSPQNWRWAS